jgi:hypothetical protein
VAEQTVVCRQVDGSNPLPGSHFGGIFKSCLLIAVMGIAIVATIGWWVLLIWLAVRVAVASF